MHPKMYFVYILLLLLLLVPLILITCISIILMVKNSVHQSNDSTIQIKLIGRETAKFLEYNEIFDKNQKKVIKKIKYHVPKFMLELYERNKSSVKKNKTGVDLVKSLIPTQAEKIKENEIFESENHLLIFNIPEHESNEKFIEAELKVLTEIEIFSTNELGVEKIISLSIYNNSSKEYKPLYKMKIYHFNDTWVTFNLTEEVGKILHENNEEKILNIIITVSSIYPELNYFTKNNNNNLKLSLLPQIETINNYDHNYPILILSYATTDDDLINKSINKTHLKIRKPRSVKLNEEDYEEETNLIWDDEYNNKITAKKYRKNTCKRRPLYIDFSEIKYDMWIVQPTGYDAYQCQGRCFYPLAEHLSPTKHAIMQALLNSLDPSRASKLCCVPTILDPISILYVDDKGVLTYRYAFRDMVVLDCGCR